MRHGLAARVTAGLAAAALGAPEHAAARDTNPEGTPVGQRGIALAGACTALGGDGGALWYNPAGLGALPGAGISANLAVYSWRTQRIDSFVDWGLEQGRADAESSDFASVPSSLVYAMPVGATPGTRPQHGIAAGLFVPDDDSYDIRVASQVVGESGAAIQVELSDTRSERSYWPGIGYGYDNGTFGLGISGFVVAHTLKRQTVASIFASGVPDLSGIALVQTLASTDVSGLAQLGFLYRPLPSLTLGLNVRSPSSRPFHQSGELLLLFARDTEPAFLDRHESNGLKTEQRTPLRLAGGAAWQATPDFLVSLDLHFTAALARFRSLDAPLLRPEDAAGAPLVDPRPIERIVDVDERHARAAVVNGAIASEYRLSPSWMLRGGFYTDLSSVKRPDGQDLMDYAVDLFGLALGAGVKGERGSTDIGILVRRGTGTAWSDYRAQALDERPVKPTTDVEVFQLAVFLGGTADL